MNMRKSKAYSMKLFGVMTIIGSVLGFLALSEMTQKQSELEISNSLKTVLMSSKQALLTWRRNLFATTKIWAESKSVNKITKDLLKTKKSHLTFSHAQKNLRVKLTNIIKTHGYKGYFIVDRSYTNIASSRDSNIGKKNLLYKQKDFFYNIWNDKQTISKLIKSDVKINNTIQVSLFSGSAIKNDEGEIVAAFLFRIDPSKDYSTILQRGRIGESGETYAITDDGILASESRFKDHLQKVGLLSTNQTSILNIQLRVPKEFDKTFPLTFMANDLTTNKNEIIHMNLKVLSQKM